MFIQRCFKSLIQKCIIWYDYLFRDDEVSEQEIEEFLAKRRAENLAEDIERKSEEQEQIRDYQESLARRKAEEKEEIERAWNLLDLEEYPLSTEEEISERKQLEQERKYREYQDESHYRTHCQFCNSQLVLGRCSSCDEVFGSN